MTRCNHDWTPFLDLDEFLNHVVCWRFCLKCKRLEMKVKEIKDGVIKESSIGNIVPKET